MAPAARKSHPPVEIEDDGPVLRPDLSDLFKQGSSEARPREAGVEELFAPADERPQEGTPSGLIDIRSLASAYFSDREAADDSKPLRPQAAEGAVFEPPKIVVVSTKEPPRRASVSRGVLMALLGLLTVAATALATTVVVKSGSSEAPAEEPSVAATPGAERPGGSGPSELEGEAPASPSLVDVDEEPAEAEAGGEDEVVNFEPDLVEPAAPAARSREDDPEVEKRPARDDEDIAEEEDEIVIPPAPAPAAPSKDEEVAAAPKENASQPAEEEEEYDDVDCLLNPGKPGCKAQGSTDTETASETENLPEHLTRAQIESGLSPIQGRLNACGARHQVTGVANLVLEIRGDGKVKSGSTRAGNPEFQRCISTLLTKARFARTRAGQTLRYPLILR